MNFKTIAVALFGVALTLGAGSAAVALTTGQNPNASVAPTIVTEFVDLTGEPQPIDQVGATSDDATQAPVGAEANYDEYEHEYDDEANYDEYEDDEYEDAEEGDDHYEDDDEHEGADDDDD